MTIAKIVRVHPLGAAETVTRTVPLKGGSEIRLRIMPIFGCPRCTPFRAPAECLCCGDRKIERLVIDCESRTVVCVACLAHRALGRDCARGWNTPGAMERHAVN